MLAKSVTPEATEYTELSSVQRETSRNNGDLNWQEWPSVKALESGSPFSGAMSDRVSTEQQ